MDVNIRAYIEKLKKKAGQHNSKNTLIEDILREHLPEISSSNFSFDRGNLFLKNMSPMKKTHIKLSSMNIKKKAQEKGIVIRDII